MPNGPHRNPPHSVAGAATAAGQPSLYPLMLDAIGEAICMFDARGEFTWQNKACMTLCGNVTMEQVPPTSFTDYLTRDQLAQFRIQLYRALGGERMFFEWVCTGTSKAFLMELRPLRDDKQVIGIMGFIRENSTTESRALTEEAATENDEPNLGVSNAFIALDKEWRYTYLNTKAETLHGVKADALIGKKIQDVFPDIKHAPFFRELQKAMDTQQPVRVELFYSTGNKWFENFIYPSTEGVTVYYRDITVQKQAEEQLVRSEHQYRSLVEQAADAIIIADLQGRCLDINTMAEKMTGYTREELAGLNIFSLLVITTGEPPIRMAELLYHQSILQERRVRRKDGTVFHAELNSKLLTGDRILVIGRDISSRKKMELELQESEMRYRTLFEEGADGVCFYDISKDRFVGVNKRMTELFGYSKEEFMEMRITGITFPDEVEQNPPRFIGLTAGVTVTNERYFRCKDGRGIWIETTTRCMGGSQFISFMRDITERRNAENVIRENELRWKLALDNSELGVWEMNFEMNTAFISDKTREQTGYQFESDLAKPDFWLNAIYADDRKATMEKFIRTLKGEIPALDATFRVVCKSGEIKWFRFTGRVTERDQALRAMRIIGVHEHITNKIMLDRQLRQFNERIQLLSKATNDAFWEWDIQTDLVWWNESCFSMFGYDPAGKIPSLPDWTRKVHPDDRDKIVGRFKRIRKNQVDSWQDSFRYQLPDGTWGSVLDRAYVIRNEEGQPERVIGAYVDITRQKEAEEKLQFEKMLSDSLIQKMPGIFYLYTRDGKFLRWNRNFETITGYNAYEIRQMHPLDFYEGEEKEKVRYRINHHFHESLPGVEVVLTTKEKQKLPIYINSMALIYEGIPCIMGMGTDITQLLRTQRDLVESEEAFSRLFRESNEAILILDGKNFIDCNDATVSLLGYDSRDAILKQPPWKISPKKQPDGELSSVKAKRLIAEALEKGYNRFEWIHRKANGTEFPVEVMLTPIFIKGRQLFYTIWRDITVHKKAEADLQASINEISDYKYAIDQATIVSFSDPAGNITHINDNFERLYGYTREEIIGVNHNILNSGMHDGEFWKKFWTAIKSGKVLKAEVCNKAKDGSLHWADTTIVPFLDAKGKPTQFLAIRNDISEKRKLEQELKERERSEQIRITETALDAQEKERNFLGQELHDNVNQILVGTKLILNVVAEDPVKYKEVLDNSIENIQRAIEENRKLSHSLATPDLKLMSLPRQLSSMAHGMFYQQPVKVTFSNRGYTDEQVDDKRKIAIYRIAQEQCTNIIKYARATKVNIRLQIKSAQLRLIIKDNGAGMEPGKNTDGIGIRNMRARVSIYGGSVEIDSAPGKGFNLTVSIPL